MSHNLRKRSEIPMADTWDVESIFPSVDAWEEAFSRAPQQLERLARFEGRLGESAATLADWMDALEDVFLELARIRVYASLGYSVEMTNQEAAGRHDRAQGLLARARATTAFAEPEILTVGEEKLRQWMEEEDRLATYEHYFDQLFRQKEHVRSQEVETLLKEVQDPFRTAATTHRVLVDADLSFEPAEPADPEAEPTEIIQGNIGALLTHEERAVRRTAWEHYADGYLSFKNTLANALTGGVKQNVFMARARCYESALEAALSPNQIPVEVFHNTVDVFRRHLPTWHRYWRVRRQALGSDRLNVYDIKAPLTDEKVEVPFEKAVAWISEGMRPLGEEYVAVMRRGLLEERWVDKYPNVGKRSGAFSSGVPGTHPFIFMSYTDDIFSLSTLAHELGHSLHSYFAWKTQPFVYARYTLFVAEVASNFNQALVRAHLLETNDDPAFQIAVLEEAMSNFYRYFFIMPTLARFELEIHQRVERGEALTADVLIGLMADLFGEGYGEEVVMDRERIGITWAQFPNHLYANFYVYQYTTGIAAAHALANRVLNGETGAADAYLDFLKAGGSRYPLEALKMAGVDMTTPEAVEQTFAVLADYVDRLEALTDGN
ncbi:MAG: oligoendopeptidase F [Candidatus Promineifilaceae bacterium]|nr:oligoendopeptidase F [Candidatus Promineifilaceae bacterium]